ncbi:MAG: DUF420 domain-containing protein, partial [Rhodospirillales bacterium]
MAVEDMPHFLAALNAATIVGLLAGFLFIRQGDKRRHRAAMIVCLCLSAAFLALYLVYKANAGFAKFGGEGWVRPVYFTILIVHVIGAFAITPLVPITVWKAV